MTFLDIILLLVLGYGFVRGLWNGFFLEFASLISLFLGIFIAIKFSGFTAEWLDSHVGWSIHTLRIASFLITFIAVVIGISLLARVVTTMVGFAGLGLINKIAGAFFGMLKMALVMGVLLTFFDRASPGEPDKDESILAGPVKKASSVLYPTLEKWVKEAKSDI